MTTKALIFAGNHSIYLNFINEYHLKTTDCRYVSTIPDIQGWHKKANPDLILIFLEDFYLTPAGNSNDEMVALMTEFAGRIYPGPEIAGLLMQLTYITKLELLPEYLSHVHEKVRDAAIKRQEELNEESRDDI